MQVDLIKYLLHITYFFFEGLTVWNWLWTICSIIVFVLVLVGVDKKNTWILISTLLGMFINVILGIITCLALFASGESNCALR